jgi:hypothetical protein
LLQALAAEKASHDQQRLQAAARPLAATLMGGVMPAVMAGLVKVALSRPADPCQVKCGAHQVLLQLGAGLQQAGLTEHKKSRSQLPHGWLPGTDNDCSAVISCLQVVADELLAAAAQLEASYADPYDAPVYGIQLAKVEAKAAREAARAAAAAAKAAR